MLLRKRSGDQLRVGDRIVSVAPIGAIPEGTHGRIKVVDGFGWIRYWVAWETGEWMGSVDGAAIVAEDRLEQYRQQRAAALQTAAVASPVGAAAADEGASGAVAGGSGVPEHLLERARQARARKAAQAGD